jgi:hypothetical protein
MKKLLRRAGYSEKATEEVIGWYFPHNCQEQAGKDAATT